MNHFFSKTFCIITLLLLSTSLLTACGTEKKTYTLNLAHSNSDSQSDPVHIAYEQFKAIVEEKSQGEMTINILPNAEYGTEQAILDAGQEGAIELISASTFDIAKLNLDFLAFALPYITQPEFQRNFYASLDNGKLGKYLENALQNLNFVPLMFTEEGYYNFVAKDHSLKSINDLKSTTLRINNSSIEEDLTASLGIKSKIIAVKDSLKALETGEVSALSLTYTHLKDPLYLSEITEIFNTEHTYSMQILLINKNFFAQLPAHLQAILKNAAKEVTTTQRLLAVQSEEDIKEQFLENEITINELTPKTRLAIIESMKPIWATFSTQISPEIINLIQETQK